MSASCNCTERANYRLQEVFIVLLRRERLKKDAGYKGTISQVSTSGLLSKVTSKLYLLLLSLSQLK